MKRTAADTARPDPAAAPGAGAPLACEDLVKNFREGESILKVLCGVNLAVREGETLAVVGASGSGKTTLLQLLGGLDRPTSGRVLIGGRDLAGLDGAERGFLRNASVGFVYQFHHLLPEFTALENVAMPLMLRRSSLDDIRDQAEALLDRVGLGDRLTHRPAELSGGERQRVAVARALVTRPSVVLADEPTGNLDHHTGQRVLELLLKLNAETGASLVIVTHDDDVARRMNRILRLEDGLLRETPAV